MLECLVQWAQLSTHRFDCEEELKDHLIYNHSPIPDPLRYFVQTYLFNRSFGGG
jgi:hypothetical protein